MELNALVIRIFEASDGGYIYDIFDTEDDDAESIDGGLCTTTLLNALHMAHNQAQDLIERNHA
jgi:hypothetical protein